jgi:hypothetical protein
MKISAIASMYMCAVFALLSFFAAWKSFTALERLTDVAEREMASGYGWFWMFLGTVALVFGVLSWAIAKGKFGPMDEAE